MNDFVFIEDLCERIVMQLFCVYLKADFFVVLAFVEFFFPVVCMSGSVLD